MLSYTVWISEYKGTNNSRNKQRTSVLFLLQKRFLTKNAPNIGLSHAQGVIYRLLLSKLCLQFVTAFLYCLLYLLGGAILAKGLKVFDDVPL